MHPANAYSHGAQDFIQSCEYAIIKSNLAFEALQGDPFIREGVSTVARE